MHGMDMEEVDEEIIWELWNDGPGGAYYFNTLTGESQWHEPECNPNQIASKLHLCETDYDWEESGETRPPPPVMKRGIAKLTALRLFKRELTPLSSMQAWTPFFGTHLFALESGTKQGVRV